MKQRRLMNQINVVPYIDVMLVLLVIFMVTAPLVQTGAVDLPSVGKSSQAPQAALRLMVKADRSLAWSSTGQERRVGKAELAALLQGAAKKQQPVLIAADKKVPYEDVVALLDEANAHGLKVSLELQRAR